MTFKNVQIFCLNSIFIAKTHVYTKTSSANARSVSE